MPFENVTRDGRIFWLGEAAAVLLTDDLNALGANAITRDERQAGVRTAAGAAGRRAHRRDRRFASASSSAPPQVVVGSLQLDGDALVVRARSIALDTGRVQADVTERGPLPELFATFERIARRIAPPSSRSSGEVEGRASAVAAFENYIKGLLAETPRHGDQLSERRAERQPTFDRARLALWDVYAEQGDHDAALAAVPPVPTIRRGSGARGFSRGLVAAESQEIRRGVRDVQGAGRRQPTPRS